MNIFEYREQLNLPELLKTGTISVSIYTSQEVYRNFDAMVKCGMDRKDAIKRLKSGLTLRRKRQIIKELERAI